mgnify:CR=1 FL=1
MNFENRRRAEPVKLWWESPWVMIALILVVGAFGVLDMAFN